MKQRAKRSLILLLSMFILLSNVLATASANSVSSADVKGHWAESVFTDWQLKGYLSGYPDGTMKPDNAIKRGEFISFVNRVFKLTESTNIQFTDVSKSDWAYNDIAIAVKAGYVKGYEDGTVGAENPITRQESTVMLSALLGLDNKDKLSFTDANDFDSWSKGAAGALAAKGIIKGYEDGSFHPHGNITRAESVALINEAIKAQSSAARIYDKAGNYGPAIGTDTIQGNVEVKVEGIVLKNLVINGDLLLAEGIGNGDVTLENVTVNGKTTVRGGGENSIHVLNSVLLTVIVNKIDGTVRIVAEGTTVVKSVTIQSSANLEDSGATGAGFSNVELAKEIPADSKITLHGSFEKVDVIATKISISVPEGTIQQLNVDKDSKDTTLTVNQLAAIVDMVLDSALKVLGQGTISNVTANNGATGSSFEKAPTAIDGEAKDSVNSAITTPTSPGSSSGSDSNNTSDQPTTPGNKSHNADLKTLSVGNLTLYQTEASYYFGDSKGDPGFNPNVSYYIAETPIGYQATDKTITIEAADAHSTIKLGLYDAENGYTPIRAMSPLAGTTYSFTLAPKSVINLQIEVKAEDGSTSKRYNAHLSWERTLAERIQMHSLSGEINVYGLSNGDKVRMYAAANATVALAEGTSNNGNTYLRFPNNQAPATQTGSVWFSLQKNGGQEEAKFQYDYDFTPINNVTNGNGIEIRKLTAEELFNIISPGYTPTQGIYTKVAFGQVDASVATQLKYVVFDWVPALKNNYVPTIEDLKRFYGDYIYSSKDATGTRATSMTTSATVPLEDNVFVYFYDAQKNPIGYYKQFLLSNILGAPVLSDVTTGKVVSGRDIIHATSDLASKLYLVSANTNYYDKISIENAAGMYTVSADSNQAAMMNTVTGATYLSAGNYKLYAIGTDGKISVPSGNITVVNAPWASVATSSSTTINLSFSKRLASFEIKESTVAATVTPTFTVDTQTATLTIASTGAAAGNTVRFEVKDQDDVMMQYLATFNGTSWELQVQ